MGKRANGGSAARTRSALIAAVGATLLLPAPAHADGYIGVYEWGVSPEAITVTAGEGVHFTNWSGLPTAIVADSGRFDSGALGPGAGFSVAMTVPGTHVYRSAANPTVELRITVVLAAIPGPPDDPVDLHVPDLPFPPAPDEDMQFDDHFGVDVSRSRILLGFGEGATVAEANAALVDARVHILGGLPETGILLVEVRPPDEEEGEGALDPLRNALSELREHAAVEFAARSERVEPDVVPRVPDALTRAFGGAIWTWNPELSSFGGNWGLEASRFPQAWNLLEAIKRKNPTVVTGIVDGGFDSHVDLGALEVRSLCASFLGIEGPCTTSEVAQHGTHVAGIIGAEYDNDSPVEPGKSRGVDGTNPVARMVGVGSQLNGQPNADWASTFQVWNLLLDEKESGALDLRVVNFSMGNSRFDMQPVVVGDVVDPNLHVPYWWDDRPDPTCGPGSSDDGGPAGTQFCTPNNDDGWLAERQAIGLAARRVAERASALNVMIVQSAGNAGDTFCVPPAGGAIWPDAIVDSSTGGCRTAAASFDVILAPNTGPFAKASQLWRAPLANPVVVVENIARNLSSAATSNYGGDISAPGELILSTSTANNYAVLSGTSMAAPHVTGLIGYLLAFDPTLSIAQVREKLLTWSRADTTQGAAPRIDAFNSLLSVPSAHRDLVDVNDPSKDGNRRVVRQYGNVEGALDTTQSTVAGGHTEPDGHIDMRDFRRFRDALLDAESNGTHPLDGPADHPKRDQNFDGCVYWFGDDPARCVTSELYHSRFDFNGTGSVERNVPFLVATDTGGAQLTDLGVLQQEWEGDPTATEGWEADDLDGLLGSGDLEIHADALFDAGATAVDLSFRNPDTGETFPDRRLGRDDDFLVATVPAGRVEITATAAAGAETLGSDQTVGFAAGADRRVDLCLEDLVLSASRTRVPAGGTATAGIFAVFDSCGSDSSGKEVTFSIVPITPDGATLAPGTATTDANGLAQTTFTAGTATAVYTVSASLDLGDGRTLEDELQIEVAPQLKISYVWRQEVLDWSESGSTRWGMPVDPMLPDCTTAPGVYCIDSFTLGPAAPLNPLEREGLIEGFGRSLRLTEEVAPAANSSRQSWTLTNPDGSNPRSAEQVVGWKVATNQLHRYTNYQLPTTMLAREDEDAIRLFGLKAVGELGYVHDAAVVTPGAQPTPIELWFTTGRLLLQPRGDGSALQYATNTTWPIEFPRRPDATFAPYSYCQTVEYDLTSQKGYWNPSSSEWIPGALDQSRKPTYSPGDRPMPVGPGHLRVRYSFAAIAQYGSEDPVAVLPNCSETHPPDAEFEFEPVDVDEGRMVSFRSTSTDPDNDIVAWEWNFADGTIVSGAPNRFGLQAHLFADNGTYEVSLKVTDSDGQSDTTSKTIVVANLPPEATIENATGVEGHPVDVPFSVWDPGSEDKQELEVEITTPSSPAPLLSTTREAGFSTFQVNGLTAGTHTLTLRVEDKDGAVATDDAIVTVLAAGETPPPPPPPGADTPTCDPSVVLDAQEQLFLGLLNNYRAQSGLAPVGVSPTLTRAAERHATDMAEHDFLSHTGSDGSTPFERAHDAGYPGETVSENAFFGSPRAQDALVGWKSSQTGHNENMLQPQWAAIGIARAVGTKWYWSTSFGDVLDCPGAAGTAAAPVSGGEEAPAGAPAEQTATEPERAPAEAPAESVRALSFASASASAPAAAEPAAETAESSPYPPLAAFTISNLSPRQNQLVTIVNRSRDAAGIPIAATLEYGDGEVVELGPDESTQVRFEAFNQTVRLSATDAGGRTSSIRREIWVEQLREPSIQYLGDTFGAVGKPLPVSAKLLSPWDNTPIAGLQVTFALGSASAVATTGADGIAQTTLVLAGATAGDAVMTVTTPGTDDFAAGSSSVFLFVVDNHAPVAKPGGPYVTGDGATLLLDGGLSTDPDPGDGGLLTYAWDLDHDGAFDDAEGATPAELQWEEIRLTICGGLCAAGTPYPIALEVTDRWGDTNSASTTLTITADFGLVLGGGTITIVPGASNSVAVTVVGSTGWTGPVTLSVTGLPAGVTATFGTNPVTPTGTSVLTLTAGASVENGTFPVRVIGTGGGLTRETGEDITVAFGLIPICFGTYSGTVVDSATGAPVPDVQIRLLNLGGSAMTDGNGRYVFRNVPLGTNNAPRTHFVRTAHNGYWEKQVPAEAVCRGVTRLDFQVVAKQTGRLSGTVIDRETRLPLTGARLTAPDGPTALTDTDGRYALDAPLHPDNQPRFYTYKAEATGYWPQDLSVTVDPAAPQERNYELLRKCQGTVRGGTVRVQQTNALVANAVVRLTLSPFQIVQVTTNAQGEFTFNRLVDLGPENTPVNYSVQAFPPAGSPPGSSIGFSSFFLESCGAEASTEILIGIPVENFGAIEGVIQDEDTLEPIAGANLRACGFTCFETASGPDGTYSFPKLPVGFDSQLVRSYTVQGSRAGYYTAFTQFKSVTANETTRFDLVLLRQKYGRLEGTVTDVVSGAPIPEAGVQAPPFGCAFDTICAITNREGHYLDATVPLGTRNAPFFRTFQVTATGYWPVTRGAVFSADTTTIANVQLLKECAAARVVGTVVNAETQAPINGALVAGGGQSVLTDPSGRFTLTGLRAGAGNSPVGVSITASASGFISQTKSITIFCGATIVVDFGSRESALGIIVGTVTNADASTPVEDVLVATEFGATDWTDASGNYRFEHVPLGDLNTDRAWKVTAFPTGFKPQTKTVVAKANVEVRADFAFTVLGNATPLADGLTAALNEDTDAIFRITGSDADDDPLTFHVMRYPAHGSLFGSAPDLFYRPDRDFNGVDTFEFVVNDGLANSERATVTLDVAPVNDAPAGFQDLFATGVDVPLRIAHADLVANDTDVDGDELIVMNVFPGSTFQVEPGDGFVLVTPPPGFESSTHVFAFNYEVGDGNGGTSFASAYVRVTSQPIAPVCADASFETEVGVPLDASVSCTDGNGDALTYELVSSPAHGLLGFNANGTFTFTPAPDFVGTTSFVFRATDGTLTSTNATATIEVVRENGPPVAADAAVTTAEDVPLAVTPAATDADGDLLTYAIGTPPSHGTLSGTAPALTYTPHANYHGPDSFTYTATDPDGASDSGTISITVTPVNDAPVANDQSVATDEDTPLAITLGASDVDGDGLTYALATALQHGSWDGTTYTPALNYHGPDSFDFLVSDGNGGSDVGTVSITVRSVNDAPVADDQTVATAEDTPLTITLTATDPDSGTPAIAVTDPPDHGTYTSGVYTPALNFNGTDSFVYTATDGDGQADNGTVTITVTPVNDAPVWETILAPQTVQADSTLTVDVIARDVDNDDLNFFTGTNACVNPAVVGGPAFHVDTGLSPFDGVVLDPTGPRRERTTLTIHTKPGAAAGTYCLRLFVGEVAGERRLGLGTVDIVIPNSSPVAVMDGYTTNEDVTLAPAAPGVLANDVDPNGDPLTAELVAGPAHGALALAPNGSFAYVPAPNFNGTDGFTYRAIDPSGSSSAPVMVSLSVDPVNDAPVAGDQNLATDEDTPLAISFGATDVEGSELTFAPATAPQHGSWDGTRYTPALNYHGPDSFDFIVSDGHGGSDVGTVSITVRPVNDAPNVDDRSLTTVQGTPLTITLAGTDVDGDTLTITHTAPAHGAYDGTTYTPAAGFSGPDSFTYTANDGHGGTDTATVSITVTPSGTDTTPPRCTIAESGKNAGGAAFIRFRVTDVGSGLARHEVKLLRNATVTVDPYTPASLGPVHVLATAVNPTKSLGVEVDFLDVAGNRAACGPAVLSVVHSTSMLQDETFTNLRQAQSLVSVSNGNPGLNKVVLIVNGKKFTETALAANEVRTFNLASAMKPGASNTIVVSVKGKKDATALIVIADIP